MIIDTTDSTLAQQSSTAGKGMIFYVVAAVVVYFVWKKIR